MLALILCSNSSVSLKVVRSLNGAQLDDLNVFFVFPFLLQRNITFQKEHTIGKLGNVFI